MKTSASLFVFLMISICFSCEKNQIKIFDDIAGKWKLERTEFLTEDGRQISDPNRENSIRFININSGRRDPTTNAGTQLVGAKEYDFKYFAAYSKRDKKLNMYVDFNKYDRKSLPLEFVGLSNVYKIVQLTDNVLVLSVDSELDQSSRELVRNLRFYFVRDN